MCWSAEASWAMVAIGGAATVVAARRQEPVAIWGTLGYFTVMELLQGLGYAVVDECGTPANTSLTVLSYLHIAFQPLFINAFAMAIAPAPVAKQTRRTVWILASLATAILLFRLAPVEALGDCAPGKTMCGPAWCLVSGNWHIAWEVPLNGLPSKLGIPVPFTSYVLAVFLLPLIYGAWRFALFHAVFGPILASVLTDNPNEMPAIWCLFSIGLLLIGLSPFIRYRAMGAHRAAQAV